MLKRRILVGVMVIMSLVMMTGCASKVGTAKDGNEVSIEAAAIKLANAKSEAGYELVSTADLKTWIDDGKDMVLIDTMPNGFYSEGHVPTALNAEMPKTGLADATMEQKESFKALLGEDKDKLIVVYCGFTACGRSDAGSRYAMELGYTNVVRYPGGIISWKDAENQVEK